MKKNGIKKLVLNRETVRLLQDSELTRVAGGRGLGVLPNAHGQVLVMTGGPCEPCPSGFTDGGGGQGHDLPMPPVPTF
ncbi:MAG: class I lanthipeptide [Phycisphaerae bacterium]|nr:class I lanthipeptide [Phycisphaerae bacterium]